MLDCNSLSHVLDDMQNRLPVSVPTNEPVIAADLGFMRASDAFEPLQFMDTHWEERTAKLVGLLFCHPGSELAKAEILPHLTHFHLVSATGMDCYCMGYGADWPPEHFVDQSIVAKAGPQTWYFSENAFVDSINQLKRLTTWTFSGETELILLTAFVTPDDIVDFDFQTAIICNLEQMQRDGAIKSARAFFTGIFSFANQTFSPDTTWDLSDLQGRKQFRDFVVDGILSLFPGPVAKAYRKARHFAVRDIARQTPAGSVKKA